MKQKPYHKPILLCICVVLLVALCIALAACSVVDKKWEASDISSQLTYNEAEERAGFAAPTDTKLAENGVADCVVQYPADAGETLVLAAEFFADTLTQIFKCSPAVVAEPEQETEVGTCISLGDTTANALLATQGVKDDGYAVAVGGAKVSIKGLTEAGTANGAYAFLEDGLQVMFVSESYDYIPYFPTVYLKETTYIDNPTFAWRRVFQYETLQNNWYRKLKNNGTEDNGNKEGANAGWGTWCHNVFEFVSPDRYFATHPQYFAQIDGERRWEIDGKTTQLCLTAPGITEVIKESLAQKIANNPDATYWDFSINDNKSYCQCDGCAKVLQDTGSMMGTMLPVINALAEEFDDKIISTLAYFFNSTPPKGMTCRDNVNITVAPIATGQAHSYLHGDTKGAQSAKHMIEQWSAVSKSILVWDYTVNFANLLMPYPNYDVQPQNHEFYEKHNVKAVFHQGSREKGDEMAAFRSYILSRQLWDRTIDWQAVAGKYLVVVYQEAAPYVAEYLDTMSELTKTKAKNLDLYDAPEAHSNDYLSKDAIKIYQDLMASAEQAAADNPVVLERLEQIKINVLYAKMYEKSFDFDGKRAAAAEFATLTEKHGILMPSEWGPSMQEFIQKSYPAYLDKQQNKLTFIIVIPIVVAFLLIGFNVVLMYVLKKSKNKVAMAAAGASQLTEGTKDSLPNEVKPVDTEHAEDNTQPK